MEIKNLFIPILLATGRKGRYSEKVAKYILGRANQYSFKTKLVDVRNYATLVTVPSWEKNKKSESWKKIIKKADGLIIVVPEYNRGYPGELKIMIDKLYQEYAGKPVALAGVSSGAFGGSRVVESLLPILTYLKMIVTMPAVYFSNVEKLFNKNGKIKDASYDEKIKKVFEPLVKSAMLNKGV